MTRDQLIDKYYAHYFPLMGALQSWLIGEWVADLLQGKCRTTVIQKTAMALILPEDKDLELVEGE